MQLARGVIVAERFELVQELGSGGMASVWLAKQMELGYLCAVKLIHPDLTSLPVVCARFEQEAMVIARLRSPNIVQILDYGRWENAPYMAMEYLEGEDLRARLDVRGRLSARETFTIVDQVARALTKAHAARLIHRDLKPENIFLARDDDREIVKVLDFGVAKALGGSSAAIRTQQGALIGTLEYMSPEQLRGTGDVDHRTDLWSLAIVTFTCLTGHQPFEAERLNDLVLRVFTGPLPRPSTFVAELRGDVDAWWERAAARNPNERFSSAREMADALGRALGISAPSSVRVPPSLPSQPEQVLASGASNGRRSRTADDRPTPIRVSNVPRAREVVHAPARRQTAALALAADVPVLPRIGNDELDIDVHVTGIYERPSTAPDTHAPVWQPMPALDSPQQVLAPRRGSSRWGTAALAAIVCLALGGALFWRWSGRHSRVFGVERAAASPPATAPARPAMPVEPAPPPSVLVEPAPPAVDSASSTPSVNPVVKSSPPTGTPAVRPVTGTRAPPPAPPLSADPLGSRR